MANSQTAETDDASEVSEKPIFPSSTPTEGTTEASERSLVESDDDVGAFPPGIVKAQRRDDSGITSANVRHNIRSRAENQALVSNMRRRDVDVSAIQEARCPVYFSVTTERSSPHSP